MIVAGCDVGSLTTKAVILKKGSIVGHSVVPTEAKPGSASKTAVDKALSEAGLSFNKIKYCVATGWGRKKVEFADKVMGEVPCIGKGARHLLPSIKTVIDMGAQTSNVIKLSDKGKVLDYATNEKCAAGTGKFLGVIAEALEQDINDMGAMSLSADKMINITNQCVVFAESEVISYVNDGEDLANIIAGINHSVAKRLVTQVNRIGFKEDVCITGGVAKNIGVVNNLAQMLKIDIKEMPEDPQIIGALGAAIAAGEKAG